MKIAIQSLHFDADKKLLDFVQQKCDKLDTFYDQVVDGNVILRIEKDHENGNKVAEIVLNVPGSTLVAKSQGKSFEEAVDATAEQLRKQLLKHKEKQRSHV
jgi:putative sigma-54 modulation protein